MISETCMSAYMEVLTQTCTVDLLLIIGGSRRPCRYGNEPTGSSHPTPCCAGTDAESPATGPNPASRPPGPTLRWSCVVSSSSWSPTTRHGATAESPANSLAPVTAMGYPLWRILKQPPLRRRPAAHERDLDPVAALPRPPLSATSYRRHRPATPLLLAVLSSTSPTAKSSTAAPPPI